MRVGTIVARNLLGMLFTVFGLNGFLHFIPMGSVPPLAGQFVTALITSHYMAVVFLLELVSGILLLLNRFVPFALVLLAPIIVNIVLFHVFLAPSGLPIAVVAAVLWSVVAYRLRSRFNGIFYERSLA
jgi:hypothetical protein